MSGQRSDVDVAQAPAGCVVGARIKIREGADDQTKPALRYGTSGVSGPSGGALRHARFQRKEIWRSQSTTAPPVSQLNSQLKLCKDTNLTETNLPLSSDVVGRWETREGKVKMRVA